MNTEVRLIYEDNDIHRSEREGKNENYIWPILITEKLSYTRMLKLHLSRGGRQSCWKHQSKS